MKSQSHSVQTNSETQRATGVARRSLYVLGVVAVSVLMASCNKDCAVAPVTTTTPSALQKAQVNLSITPSVIQAGQTADVSWTTDDETSCVASGAWSGTEPIDDTAGWVTPDMTKPGTYSYTLTCTGPNGTTTNTQELIVGSVPAPTVAFNIAPQLIQPGDAALLTWSTTLASSCTASGGTSATPFTGTQSLQNTQGTTTGAVSAAGEYPYTLTCTGPGGTSSASGILTVAANAPPAPPTLTLNASPVQILPGGSTTLSWTSANATTCTATGGSGSGNWSGNVGTSSTGMAVGPIAAAGTYTYTLNCVGAGGSASQNATVIVSASPTPLPISVNMVATPSTVTTGNAASLSWTSTNATSCVASGSWAGSEGLIGSGVSTGTLSTTGVYSYTLTCSGPGGSASSTATVEVVNPPATVVSFAATPQSVIVGGSINLSWATNNASSCSGSGGSTGDGWNGSTQPTNSAVDTVGPLNTIGTYQYTLTCTGAGGPSAPSTVSVTVSAVPGVPAVTSFNVNPIIVQVGNTVTASWSSVNTTSCTGSNGAPGDGWAGPQAVSNTGLNIGPINAAGVYTYTLTCSGPGGTSVPATAVVTAVSTPPLPVIQAFNITPTTVQVGQSVLATWASIDATSCTASGGSSGDGWTGTQPTFNLGMSVGPISTAGTYTYTLTCTGPGGTSAASSIMVTATTAPPPATINSFTVTPAAIQVGQSVTVSWSSSNATTCTGTNGTLTDGWDTTWPPQDSGLILGPLVAVGTVTYTLTCSGAGGSSAPSSASVTVSVLPPAATITSFIATPSNIQTGQGTTLTWTTSNALTCTASGAWSGLQATSSTGTAEGPYGSAGSNTYTLTCTGVGGTSAPSSVTVNVSAATTPPTITSLTAHPTSVQEGGSTSLSWSSTNATSCTAGGGTGSDTWSGTQSVSSAGTTVGPINTVGQVTYTLTCTGAGGTSAPSQVTVTATAPPPGPPTVALLANGSSTAQIQPGQSFTLTWTTTNATTCSANGGTGSDVWTGNEAINSSTGVSVGPVNTPGVYTYGLSCTGPGGSGSSSVTVTVISSASADCGIGTPSTLLQTPYANVNAGYNGLLCVGCSATSISNVINSNTTDYGTLQEVAGVAGYEWLEVTDTAATFPANRKAGFLMADPNSLLSLGLLSNIVVDTFSGTTLQDSNSINPSLLNLTALGLFADPNEAYVSITTTKPFNAVRVRVESLGNVLSVWRVYGACVTLQ